MGGLISSENYFHCYLGYIDTLTTRFQAVLFSSLKQRFYYCFQNYLSQLLLELFNFSVLTQVFQQLLSDDTFLSSSIFC